MPLYTLKKLIDDCSKKKWKTRRMPKGIPEKERVQIYEEIWMALNLWLRAVMEQGKGGHKKCSEDSNNSEGAFFSFFLVP